ncbi:SRPBCC family protein [uncultured Jatrophihabitans sp.]|uniref:SRPBCC family protein n=1 Tax=uncultured Jatrophihabitans sp. TaxID=1610747 RepID=UPI0035CC8091
MSSLSQSLVVTTTIDRVADYLGDLTTSVQWDPHTVACRRLDHGSIGVGTRYAHTREFHGYEVTLDVEVVAFEPGTLVAWSGGHPMATGREEFRFHPADGGGTVVDHTVEVTLAGIARLGERMVPSVMKRIADDGTDVLRERLEQLC